MKFKRLRLVLTCLITLTMVISIVGCGNKQAPTPSGGDSKTQPQDEKAKLLIMSRPVDSDNLDPVIQDGNVNLWMFNLALETLVKTSEDGNKIEPGLAESWDVSSDSLTYTFHIRKGLKFSDGTPVKGEDFVWTLLRARDTKDSPWKFALEAVKDVTAPDDTTVIVTLKQPWAPILADLAMFNCVIEPKAYYEKVGPEVFSQKPMGTGPYILTEWKKGEYIQFDRNPNYWQPGLPKTDQIKVTVVPDDNTRMMQLQSGDADITTFVPFNRMAELNQGSLVSMGLPSTQTNYIQINNTKKIFSDVRVRQALDMATDKNAISKTVLYGYGLEAKSFMARAGMYWNEGLQINKYDPEKAKQLLAEAGYPNGFDCTITLPSGNTVNAAIATILKEQWSKVGIKVTLETLEAATVTQKYRGMQTDITLRAWTNDICDASQQVDYAVVAANTKNFYTGWDDPEVEKLAAQAKSELDPNKRKDMYYKIQELYQKAMPMVTLFHVPYPVAMKKSVKGFVQTPLGNYLFQNLERVGK